MHHGSSGRDDLGEGRQIEQCPDTHGDSFGPQRGIAEGLAVDDPALVAHEYDGSGNPAALDLLLNDLCDAGQVRPMKPFRVSTRLGG